MRTMITLPLLLIAGCASDTDDRLVQMAREHEARQAEQSQQMAKMQHEIAEGSRRLVEADAKARMELTELQQSLRADQAEIGQQRDQLETERRTIAGQRYRDPLVATAITITGLLLACLLPVLACMYVLWCVSRSSLRDDGMTELLIDELIGCESPLLLRSPVLPAIEHDAHADIPPDDDRSDQSDDSTPTRLSTQSGRPT